MKYYFVEKYYESEYGGASYADYEVVRGAKPREYGPVMRGDTPSSGWKRQSVKYIGEFDSWLELCNHELFADYPNTHVQFVLAHCRGWDSVSI